MILNTSAVSDAHFVEPFVEAPAVAGFLHCSVRSVMQKARDGVIPAHPFGDGPRKRWFFLISEIADFLRKKVNSASEVTERDHEKGRIQ